MLLKQQEYPSGLKDFVDIVVPILQERSIFHTEYESNTLRGICKDIVCARVSAVTIGTYNSISVVRGSSEP